VSNRTLNAGVVVKCHNDLIQTPLIGFTPLEQDLFWTLCAKIRNHHDEIMTFSFEYLRDLTEAPKKSDKDFFERLRSMYKKLQNLKAVFAYKRGREVRSEYFLLRMRVNLCRKLLQVQVGDEFLYLLNDLQGDFTKFLLEDYIRIRRNRYAKTLFVQLKRYRLTGEWNVQMEKFRELLDIPASYKMRDIQKRIIRPAFELLSDDFRKLEVREYRNGHKVAGLEFGFTPDRQLSGWAVNPDFDNGE